MTVIAEDGYLRAVLARRKRRIPGYAIIFIAACAFAVVLAGTLEVILEFGSVTFLLVSVSMAYANFRIRKLTGSSATITLVSLAGLLIGTMLILYFELNNQPR